VSSKPSQSIQQSQNTAIKKEKPTLLCSSCKRSFNTTTGLKVHKAKWCKQANIKTSPAKYGCPNCKRGFDTDLGLKTHISRWCTSGTVVRSTRNQRATKRAVLPPNNFAKADHPTLSNYDAVNEFVYLGQNISNKRDYTTEISRRLALASDKIRKLAHIWGATKIKVTTKVRLYKSLVLSTLLYGAETWIIPALYKKKLEAFQHRLLKRILSKDRDEHAVVADLRQKCNTPTINSIIERRQLRLWHKYQQPDSPKLPQTLLQWQVQGRKRPGGQLKTWVSQIKEIAIKHNIDLNELQQVPAKSIDQFLLHVEHL